MNLAQLGEIPLPPQGVATTRGTLLHSRGAPEAHRQIFHHKSSKFTGNGGNCGSFGGLGAAGRSLRLKCSATIRIPIRLPGSWLLL
jgi:hypothetical protein